MDLSFNKINDIKQSNANISFKGIKGELDASNSAKFQFTPPPHNHDERVVLEFAYLETDPKTGLFNTPKTENFKEYLISDDKPLELNQEKFQQDTQSFAYRYRIEDEHGNVLRYYNDDSQTIASPDGKCDMNIINQGSSRNYGISPKGGTMYHAFVDSNPVLKKNPNKQEVNARNHFNKIGGTIKDILYLLKETDTFDPYTYLMLNPDIGADRISSHKYWPENQYQCTNLDDFKELNVELFKQGKSYVADGAFTSQGLNSPLVQHVFKWGEKSPFYNMLKIDGRFCPGVLPNKSANDKVDVYENIGIRIVNAPNYKDYDKSKPTYIQFFDKRLLSEEKQDDTKNLYFEYDREPKDHYDTVKHDDSVLPLAFEIDAKDPKIKQFKGKSKLMLDEIPDLDNFLNFKNATIKTKSFSMGATNWDGNVDIIKMNTSNPNPGTEEGCKAARKYLLGVATYWTETVQRSLLKETALMNASEKQAVARKNGIDPDRYQKITAAIKSKDFESRILSQAKTVENYISTFPLQSIETAPELSAVFSEPQFNAEFLAAKVGSETVASRLSKIVNETIDAALPERFKNDSDYRTYVVKTYGEDIIKSALVSAMGDDIVNQKDGSIDLEKLKNINVRTYSLNPDTPDEERKEVIKGLAKGLQKADTTGVQKKMAAELAKISLYDFKLSESIVLQGKGGLNWRFDAAKDIGDLDAVRNENADFKDIWEDIVSFWRGFVGNIREENPSSYIINEITELAEFYTWHNIDSIRRYGGDAAVEQFNMLNSGDGEFGKGNYKFNVAYKTEKGYLPETNSTTTSMFDEGFNRFSVFASGVDPETGENPYDRAGSVKELMKQMKELQRYTQPNNSIYAHAFTQNHDKPSILHTMPLDMGLFLLGDMSQANSVYKHIARDITGRSDYENISSKAVAVGFMLKEGIKKYVNPKYHDKLFKAITNLANGRRNDTDKPDFSRAEAFGTLPYELSLKDIIEDAGLGGKIDPISLQFAILQEARDNQMTITRTANALPGIYTLFNGAEFGQTGYETKNKNVHVTNRNRILRELKDNKLFAPYVKETQANLALYKEPGMSSLSGGFKRFLNLQSVVFENKQNAPKPLNNGNYERYKEAIVRFMHRSKKWPKEKECVIDTGLLFKTLDNVKGTDEYAKLVKESFGIDANELDSFNKEYEALKNYFTKNDKFKLEMSPVYAYDEKGSRTLMIVTNNGLTTSKQSPQYDDGVDKEGKQKFASASFKVKNKKETYEFESISLIDKESNSIPLEEGTILKRKIYDAKKGKYVDEKCDYIVHEGKLMKKSAVGKKELSDRDYIVINDTTAAFYVPKEGQKYKYLSALYNGTK